MLPFKNIRYYFRNPSTNGDNIQTAWSSPDSGETGLIYYENRDCLRLTPLLGIESPVASPVMSVCLI